MFLELAGRVSADLRDAIDAVGPLIEVDRRAEGLGMFLARVVIGQQLSTRVARAIWARLEGAGRDRHGALGLHLFQADNHELIRQCGASGAKARALVAIADAAAAGDLDGAALAEMEEGARRARLLTIRGIGPWSADMAAIFYFGEPDIWPTGDAAAVKTLGRHLPADSGLSVAEAAELFSPHRSTLARYMWRITDADLP